MSNSEKYKIKEISIVLDTLGQLNLIEIKDLEIFEKIFILKRNQLNIMDFSIFCKYFFKFEHISEKIAKIIEEIYLILKKNIEINSLEKMFTNISFAINEKKLSKIFLRALNRSLNINLVNKKIKGSFKENIKIEIYKIRNKAEKQKFLEFF